MIKLAHKYRAGYFGCAIGLENTHSKGFEGRQFFMQLGRKVWVWRIIK